jgi:hypothetical protein
VADSECEATPVGDLFDYDDLDLDEEAPPVILSGKMTLSVINLPEAIAAEAAAAAAAAASVSKRTACCVFTRVVFRVAKHETFLNISMALARIFDKSRSKLKIKTVAFLATP